LTTCKTIQEIQQKIQDYITSTNNKNAEWIFANGYTDNQFPQSQPHRRYLDEICPDKPLSIMRFDGHAYLVNTKALEIANITSSTVNPSDGIIEKDAHGEITGVLEESAMNFMRAKFPTRKSEDLIAGIETAFKLMLEEGITGFNDASVKPYMYSIYKEIYSRTAGNYPRGSLSIHWDKEFQDLIDKQKRINLPELVGIPETERLRVNSVKFFVDGVLRSQTALLEQPYLMSEKIHYGIQKIDEESLKKYVALLHSNNIQAHFHSIGNKAIRISLDAVEYARESYPDSESPRHYLAHLHLVNDKDYQRFKDLGVCANFSPLWCWYDENIQRTDPYLEPERRKVQYPIKDIMKTGATVTFGSDWPVTTYRPLDGIEVAVTRKEPGNKDESQKAWCEDQCVNIEEAVLAYTINSAYTNHQEKIVGSLEEGKKADIVVLNHDIFTCDASEISKAQVKMTILNGVIVHNHLINEK